MAHPEHDAALGRLAAARLRAGRVEARLDAHPDAETWAAYADGGLAPAEMAGLEAHLATCASCRLVVTALAPEPAIADVAGEPDTGAATGPARVLPFHPRATWVWMSMAAALLAAVTIWSVTRFRQPEATMAARATPETGAPVSAPAESMPEPAAPPAASADASRPADPAAAAPALKTRGATPARSDELDRAQRAYDKKMSDGDVAARDRAPADAEASRSAAAGAVAPKPEAAGRVAANEAVVVAQPAPAQPAPSRPPASSGVHGPAVNTQQQNQQALNAQAQLKAPAEGQLAQAQEKERAAVPVVAPAAAPAPPPQAAAQVSETVATTAPAARSGARRQGFGEAKRDVGAAGAGRREEAALADAVASTPEIAFAEPGGRLRWRIVGGHRIDSSSDAGITWNERYRVAERLRAGSAPAIDAAWAVGEAGVVLRLAVPGTWTAVARPAAVALVGVTASSADDARATAEDGRVFETTDGGRSWRAVDGAGVPPR